MLLNLDPWWDEPTYQAARGSSSTKGTFILAKLAEHDPIKLKDVLADVYRDEVPGPAGHYQVRVGDHPAVHGCRRRGDQGRATEDGKGLAMSFEWLVPVLSSWPVWAAVVVVVFLLMFRAQIRALIERVTGIGRSGITVASQETQAAPPVPLPPTTGGLDELVAELDNPHFRTVMTKLSAELDQKGINRDPTRSVLVLTKMLAGIGIAADFENIEGAIYGSQVDILTFLNTVQSADRARLLPAHERAVARYPELASYPFDDYAAFLVNRGLVTRECNTFALTDKGRAFLMWRVHTRRGSRVG